MNYKYDVGDVVFIAKRIDGESLPFECKVKSKSLETFGLTVHRAYRFESRVLGSISEHWVFASLEDARAKIEQVRGA